jgi:hypothetical protein
VEIVTVCAAVYVPPATLNAGATACDAGVVG